MPLQLTLDYGLQIVAEPGYYQHVPSIEWEKVLNPNDTASNKAFWTDQATRTLMLMPMQLQKGWLDTASQLPSVVGLSDRGSGMLQTHPDNLSNFRIFEANLKQNLNNPWVYFSPIPGTTGSYIELLVQLAIAALNDKSGYPINTTDTRVIAYSQEAISGNQALYLRWFQPEQQIGQSIMGFTIGEYALVFAGDRLQILRDTSDGKDRTKFEHVMYAPLFAASPSGANANNAPSNRATPSEGVPGIRSILWLPFHRNMVYIEASSGNWAIVNTRTTERLNGRQNSDPAQDWDIVDDRQLLVWGYTPSTSCFQIQKVQWYGPSSATVNLPTFTLDYSPAVALSADNFVVDADTHHGVSLVVGVPHSPPLYDDTFNSLTDCPAVTTDITDQTRQYGVTFTLGASADQRYTPFVYGVDVIVDHLVGTWPKTGLAVLDTHTSTTHIQRASLSSGLGKGHTQLEVDVIDSPPLPLGSANLYYRSDYPIALTEVSGPTNLFIGIAEPNLVHPLRYDTGILREVKFTASDLWKRLDQPMRDTRDWTGSGHINVVDFIVQLAGIDTSGADYPTPLADWNTKLGGATKSIPIQDGTLKPQWKAKGQDTYATFITRIAEVFAGFVVGFYPNGQFYYLPQVPVWFYNSSEGTFYKSRAANPAGPCYESPVQTEFVEPEANVVQLLGKDLHGNVLRSTKFVDWPSILNPNAVNFIGYWKPQITAIDGTVTCSEINRMAKVAFLQARRRHFKVRFRADYVSGLRVGRVFTLEGQPGTYRLLSYRAEYIREGWKQAQYEAEAVELGYS